jgi:Membrane domain of glycerophosphoryl diester phosphodiesterase
MACRLIVSIPAAVLENLGARKALRRSLALTRSNAGRAFMIILLYFVLAIAVGAVFTWPPSIGLVGARNNPAMMRMWMAITQVSTEFAGVLITPVLMIAISVFYFDLRVRKEAFDLQMMLNPAAGLRSVPGAAPSAP